MNTVKNFQGEILNLDHPETTLGVRMIFSNKTFRLLVFKDRPETHTRNFLSRSCHCATQQLKATGLEGADSLLETIRKPSYLLQEISNQLLSLSHCGFNFHTLRIKCLKEEIIITKEPLLPQMNCLHGHNRNYHLNQSQLRPYGQSMFTTLTPLAVES